MGAEGQVAVATKKTDATSDIGFFKAERQAFTLNRNPKTCPLFP